MNTQREFGGWFLKDSLFDSATETATALARVVSYDNKLTICICENRYVLNHFH